MLVDFHVFEGGVTGPNLHERGMEDDVDLRGSVAVRWRRTETSASTALVHGALHARDLQPNPPHARLLLRAR